MSLLVHQAAFGLLGAPRAVHLVLAGAHVPPMRLTPNVFGQGPAPTHAAPGRRRSDPEVRVASAVATRGRTGNLTALNLHLLFLLRGRRLRRDSPTQARDEYQASAMPTAAGCIHRK